MEIKEASNGKTEARSSDLEIMEAKKLVQEVVRI